MNLEKETLTELLEILENIKGGYKRPIKIWLWGQAIGPWIAIILVGGMFSLILLYFLFCMIMGLCRTIIS